MNPRGEFEWIERLVEIVGAAGIPIEGGVGIGDDAAVLAGPDGDPWVWTVDTMVEGVHFRFDWLDPEAVGHRAMAAALSDLAAMGAAPMGALVTVAGSAAAFDRVLEGVYRGLSALAAEVGCSVIGGDISRGRDELHVTITALGRVEGGPALLRSGAREGDEVWVTGSLGGPAAAVAWLERGDEEEVGVELEAGRTVDALQRFARPQPRIPEILWLRGRSEIHAVIDVSDGVSGDCRHVADGSEVRIVLDPGRLPVHGGAVEISEALNRDPVDWALHGGEEFELLLFVPPDSLGSAAGMFSETFGIPITRIGLVEEGAGVFVSTPSGEEPLSPRSWDHFGT
jgi:thiamine-monophosphate kinase